VVGGPIDELAGGVQADLQVLGELGQRGHRARGLGPTNREQQLVLGRWEPVRSRGILREGEEPAQCTAELRERGVLGVGEWPFRVDGQRTEMDRVPIYLD
jgi:hypothetical protein